MEDEKKTHVKHENKIRVKTISLWKISTAVLAVLLIAAIATKGFAFGASKGMSENAVADKTIKYINENLMDGQATAKLDGIEKSGDLYLLKLNVNGQKINSYATKDGSLLFPQVINLNEVPQKQAASAQEESAPTNVPKTDKPKVELFVMSHCPYGTQIEKGMIPVAKALDGKMDFEVKFVNYAMHGEKELQEELRQYCVQKDYNSKYMQYLSAFLEAGDSQKALSAIGITDSDISACVKDTDTKFKVTETFNNPQKTGWRGSFPPFAVYDLENNKYGVQGSPTLVINGKQVRSGRDAKSLLAAICNAYNNKPAECNADMSLYGNPAPGFGFGTQGGSATTAGCVV
ncbi:MAG: thioredoxin domain-containing protein [Nanoarchaeota archaeon]|nr:thioredoxin domain-containing protein [Nanoarchaeota archaeon]